MWCDVKLLDLILPVRCVVCGAGGEQLCPACRGALRRLSVPLCARCGAPTAWPVQRCRECAGRRLAFVSARAAVAYDPAVRQFVRAWKERGLRTLAAEAADAVADALPSPGRTRPASRQRGLTLTDRRRNVAGAFTPAGESPPRVALVDDVYTSGSTANAASSALRKAGARRVEVITFARVVR